MSVLDWSEEEVAGFLQSAGFPNLSAKLLEHGISGEVLLMMESDDLKDVGVSSLGMRLSILKTVEALKAEHGLHGSLDDDLDGGTSYNGSFLESDTSLASSRPTAATSPPSTQAMSRREADLQGQLDSITNLIVEQTERIDYLEEVIMSLTGGSYSFPLPNPTLATAASTSSPSQHLEGVTLDTPPHEQPPPVGAGANRPAWLKKQPSFKWASYGRKASKGSSPVMSTSVELDGERDQAVASGGTSPLAGMMRLPPAHASAEAVSPKTPTNAMTLPIPHPAASTSIVTSRVGIPVSPSNMPDATTTATPSTSGLAAPTMTRSSSATTPKPLTAADSPSILSTSAPLPPTAPLSTSSKSSTAPTDARASTSTLGSAQNPQKFKVTLDDPCWKVLPAALKKYKIQDDWRMYALFICYGSTGPGTGTERCLSYDEKPLLLFQKLKETNQSPVFMLRHIRDIKSPITLAQSKQAAKAQAQQSPSASQTLAPPPATAAPAASTSANPHPSARQSMMPQKSTGTSAAASAAAPGDPTAALEDKMTYAVAIYPYDPEREDEFLVGVDDTFLVLSKAKGWWIVQRDTSGSGTTAPDSALAGWVPAGCLLELARPPATSGGAFGGAGAAKGKLRLGDVVSTSYPGVALMSYAKAGGDEMDLSKDDVMWVFKRYSHWSYAIKESTSERGWVPSWFIGSQPPSAAAPAGGGTTAGEGVPQTPRIVGSPSGKADLHPPAAAALDQQGQTSGKDGAF